MFHYPGDDPREELARANAELAQWKDFANRLAYLAQYWRTRHVADCEPGQPVEANEVDALLRIHAPHGHPYQRKDTQ